MIPGRREACLESLAGHADSGFRLRLEVWCTQDAVIVNDSKLAGSLVGMAWTSSVQSKDACKASETTPPETPPHLTHQMQPAVRQKHARREGGKERGRKREDALAMPC